MASSNWLNVLSGLLSNQTTQAGALDLIGALSTHMQGSSTMQTSVMALLQQMQINPTAAPAIAAQIAAIPGVPPSVLAIVNEVPAVADNKVALIQLIAQAEAAVTAATSPNTMGNFFRRLQQPTG
jgi:hypothetical protein